jgi:hypothetical protein
MRKPQMGIVIAAPRDEAETYRVVEFSIPYIQRTLMQTN